LSAGNKMAAKVFDSLSGYFLFVTSDMPFCYARVPGACRIAGFPRAPLELAQAR
jgi:hypothetical protein